MKKHHSILVILVVLVGFADGRLVQGGDSTAALGSCTNRAGDLLCISQDEMPAPPAVARLSAIDTEKLPTQPPKMSKPEPSKDTPPQAKKESSSDHPILNEVSHEVISPTAEEVRLHLNGVCVPKVGTLKTQSSQVVYFDCAGMTYGKAVKVVTLPNGSIVKRVLLGRHEGNAPKTRVSIDVGKTSKVIHAHHFDEASSTLIIRFDNDQPAQEQKATAEVKPSPPVAKERPATTEAKPSPSIAKEQPTQKKDKKPNDQEAPAAPSTSPNPPPQVSSIPTKSTWTLTAGETVGRGLQTWAEKAGWKVVWNMSKDWAVPASSTFHGDFQAAASEVISTLAANGALVRAQFFSGNKTLLVTGPGESSQ
jgi:outer membrane biosynthesis protein TonB